jgi:intracellular multiplication protein IcmD
MVARRALAFVLVASLLAASIPSGARAAGNAATGPAVAFGNLLLRDTEGQQLLDSVVGQLSPATVEQMEELAQLASSGATPQEIEQQLQVIVCSLPTATESNIQQLTSRLSSVAGAGLIAAALLKFKQHRDNPTQHPIDMPRALFFIAVELILLPSILATAGVSMFGCTPSGG